MLLFTPVVRISRALGGERFPLDRSPPTCHNGVTLPKLTATTKAAYKKAATRGVAAFFASVPSPAFYPIPPHAAASNGTGGSVSPPLPASGGSAGACFFPSSRQVTVMSPMTLIAVRQRSRNQSRGSSRGMYSVGR